MEAIRLASALVIAALGVGCMSIRPIDPAALVAGTGGVLSLAPNEGLLVVPIQNAMPISRLDIDASTAITDLPKGEHVLLFAVSEGSHRWTDIVIPASSGKVPFRTGGEAWRFRVVAGRTNYPGHMVISGSTGTNTVEVGMRFRNRSALVLGALRERFPGLVERFPPIYTGRGEDAFLEYYSETYVDAGSSGEPSGE